MSILRTVPLPVLTPETHKHLPWVDFSTLTAVNTCPRWGVINSYHGKRWKVGGRSMALEAGRAMHDLFAAVRMFELMQHDIDNHERIRAFIRVHGERLFGEVRWSEAMQMFHEADDYNTRMMRFALNLLETAGFYDDPSDRKRTQTNLETAAIAYIDMYPKRRYIPYTDEHTGFVGVEMHFDLLFDDEFWHAAGVPGLPSVRFVGKMDALCYDLQNNSRLEVQENKTGSRIDTVWMDGFTISHQPTGYDVAASVTLGTDIWTTNMWGSQIPVPKQSMFTNGQARIPVTRDDDQVREWIKWVAHTWAEIVKYQDSPTDAPMYTHSCSRYFSSCAFIPLCAEGPEQRKRIFEQEMITERWSPLEEGA